MAAYQQSLENSFVNFSEGEIVEINYRNRKIKFAVASIRKIYLSKRKPSYFTALLGNFHISRAPGYKLYLQNYQNATVVIDIIAADKYIFVKFVSRLRTEIEKLKTTPKISAKSINYKFADTEAA